MNKQEHQYKLKDIVKIITHKSNSDIKRLFAQKGVKIYIAELGINGYTAELDELIPEILIDKEIICLSIGKNIVRLAWITQDQTQTSN
jgi:hypothetical protein